jgi:hypothetical protein
MSIYQRLAGDLDLKGLFITSAKQMKSLSIDHFADYSFIAVNGLVLKDLVKLLQQNTVNTQTDIEQLKYNNLMNSIMLTEQG